MRRVLLPALTAILLLLVVIDLVRRIVPSHPATVVVADSSTPAAPPSPPTGGTSRPVLPSLDETTRQNVTYELERSGQQTFLDSLLVTTDSVIRRWPDAQVRDLRVAVRDGGTRDYQPRFRDFVRSGLSAWEGTLAGVRFTIVPDTLNADIVVEWVDRFDFDRAGQTDLTWDQSGRIRRARIDLAVRASNGVLLPDQALKAVATHEVGHAIGLPHSADSNDVMYPATRAANPSDRDRRSAVLLYRLPTGSIKAQRARATGSIASSAPVGPAAPGVPVAPVVQAGPATPVRRE